MPVGGDTFEHYRVLRREDGRLWELGRGATGVTYKATDTNLDSFVALKVINASFLNEESARARFRREARAAASLQHPNVAGVLHLGSDEANFFYAMEFIDGETIEAFVERAGPLPWREALRIARGVASALTAAHAHKLVHRDIQPANVMLVVSGEEDNDAPQQRTVKVIDFSLAKAAVENGGGTGASTAASDFLGAPTYASPEQLRGEALDTRSDIYSLGVTLWFLLTGQPPFDGAATEVLAAHLSQFPPVERLPHDLPAPVRELLVRMLAKDRTGRPSTPEQLCQEIDAYMQNYAAVASAARASTPLPAAKPEPTVQPPESRAIPAAPASQTQVGSVPLVTKPMVGRVESAEAVASKADTPATDAAAVVPDENLQFTAYRPKIVRPGKWAKLLVFAHLDERPDWMDEDERAPLEEMEAQAQQILGPKIKEYRQTTDDSRLAVPRDGEITLVPEMPGVEFNPPRRSFFWKDGVAVHNENFELRAGAPLDGQVARGRLTIFLGHLILAEISLAIRVDSHYGADRSSSTTPDGPRERTSARPFRRIFASYSHRDMDIVEAMERHARSLGDEYLRDWVHLRSGEFWNDRIQQMITEADVFQLFWSRNSAQSDFVAQEWSYALQLHRDAFVRPTYWQDPMPDPPEPLRPLHFHRLATTPAPPATAAVSQPEPEIASATTIIPRPPPPPAAAPAPVIVAFPPAAYPPSAPSTPPPPEIPPPPPASYPLADGPPPPPPPDAGPPPVPIAPSWATPAPRSNLWKIGSAASAAAVVLLLCGTWFVAGRRQSAGPTLAQQAPALPPPELATPAPTIVPVEPSRGPMIAAAPSPPSTRGPTIGAAPPQPAARPSDEYLTATAPRAGGQTIGKAGPQQPAARPPGDDLFAASTPPSFRGGSRDTMVGSAGPRSSTVVGEIGTLRDTLERTGRLTSLSPSLKARVSADLERGRGLRDVNAIPFSTNATSLRRDQVAQLAPAIAARSNSALALVVLGYANEGNQAERSLAVSRQCAESVASALKGRGGVTVPVYWFAMGDGAGLLGSRRDGSRRFVEVWAIDP